MKASHIITATLVATLALTGHATTGSSGQTSNSSKVVKTLSEKSTPQEIVATLTGTWESCITEGNNSYDVQINYTPSKDSKTLGSFYGTIHAYDTPNCQGEVADKQTINAPLLSIEHHKNPKDDQDIADLMTSINHVFPHLKHTKWVPFMISIGEAEQDIDVTDTEEQPFLISTDGQYFASDEFVVKKSK